MPQLDHYNFTLAFACFSICFLVTMLLVGAVYLPMLYRHQKVREFTIKELLGKISSLKLQKALVIKAREDIITKTFKEKVK